MTTTLSDLIDLGLRKALTPLGEKVNGIIKEAKEAPQENSETPDGATPQIVETTGIASPEDGTATEDDETTSAGSAPSETPSQAPHGSAA